MQEVFLRLWNDPERFDPARGALRSYVLAQVHGRSVDLVRAESARRSREERDARRTVTVDRDLEREVWELTLHEHVRDALTELNEGERQAIELAYFGGHTYREVADLLGEPEGTVKSRIRSGLGRLRDSLKMAGLVGTGGAVGGDLTLTPAELDELLGAYTLDAVDGDEREQVEAWIARTPDARRDVDELRETASLLTYIAPTTTFPPTSGRESRRN